MTDYFPLIATQRRAVADILESLSLDEWQTPSLCGDWRVAELAAHLTMPFRLSTGRFLVKMVGAGGNFNKVNDQFARTHASEPPSQLITWLRDNAESHFVAPLQPPVASLVEIVVHGFDLSVPTGRHLELPEVASVPVLDHLVTSKAAGVFAKKGLAAGVRLVSRDSSWSWGQGPEVRGTNFALIETLAGRHAGLEQLEGEGVATVRQRLGV